MTVIRISKEEQERASAEFRARMASARAEMPAEHAEEGWSVIPDAAGHIAQWYWVHVPSNRSISLDEYADKCVIDRCGARGAGWFVSVRAHDEHGNPTAGEILGPYPLFTEAMTVARAQRRHILAERRDVAIAEQVALFQDGDADAGDGGSKP